MNYTELYDYLIDSGLDTQTAGRLAESIFDAGGIDSVINILSQINN